MLGIRMDLSAPMADRPYFVRTNYETSYMAYRYRTARSSHVDYKKSWR